MGKLLGECVPIVIRSHNEFYCDIHPLVFAIESAYLSDTKPLNSWSASFIFFIKHDISQQKSSPSASIFFKTLEFGEHGSSMPINFKNNVSRYDLTSLVLKVTLFNNLSIEHASTYVTKNAQNLFIFCSHFFCSSSMNFEGKQNFCWSPEVRICIFCHLCLQSRDFLFD